VSPHPFHPAHPLTMLCSPNAALQPTEQIRAVWSLPFRLTYTVHLLPYSLRLSLNVQNPTDAVASLPFQALLHAYFRLPEGVLPPQTLVSPLENLAYNDKVTGEQKVNESRKVVDVDGPKGEVDRVYFRAPDELTIAYKGRTDSVKVTKNNLPDAVVSLCLRIDCTPPSCSPSTDPSPSISCGTPVPRRARRSKTCTRTASNRTSASSRA
jgi:hypothetical protein